MVKYSDQASHPTMVLVMAAKRLGECDVMVLSSFSWKAVLILENGRKNWKLDMHLLRTSYEGRG